MFDNVDNRLQQISGNSDFYIIRRVSDNKIFKNMISANNKR